MLYLDSHDVQTSYAAHRYKSKIRYMADVLVLHRGLGWGMDSNHE